MVTGVPPEEEENPPPKCIGQVPPGSRPVAPQTSQRMERKVCGQDLTWDWPLTTYTDAKNGEDRGEEEAGVNRDEEEHREGTGMGGSVKKEEDERRRLREQVDLDNVASSKQGQGPPPPPHYPGRGAAAAADRAVEVVAMCHQQYLMAGLTLEHIWCFIIN